MVDVLYFDYWTRGIRHFENIDSSLKTLGYSSLLVHMDSMREKEYEPSQIKNGILCKDISLYSNSLTKVLLVEAPRLLIILNNQTEDKILLRACRALKIKTIFLMHGALVPPNHMIKNAELIDTAFNISKKLKKFPKYIRLLLEYQKAAFLDCWYRVFDLEIYLYLYRVASSPGRAVMGFWKYKDSCADLALVYSEEDKENFQKIFGYYASQVVVVGNYNLDHLIALKKSNLPLKENNNGTSKYAVYIENGFSDPKFKIDGWSEELVSVEIKNISKILKKVGVKLVVKLHPSSDYPILPELLEGDDNIELVLNCDLSKLILDCAYVFGQSSTALLLAFAIDKPVFLLSLHPLKLQLSIYQDKGLGILVESYDQLRSIFLTKKYLSDCNLDERRSYFMGPLDGLSNTRIVEQIRKVLH